MQNKIDRAGPVNLSTTLTTNILTPAAAGAGAVGYTATATYILIRKVKIVNRTGATAKVSLWLGATGANAAGTEFLWQASSVNPNAFLEEVGLWRLNLNEFIVGGSDTLNALTFEATIELGLAG